MFWCFYILYLATKIKLIPENLGILSEENQASSFSKKVQYYWEEKKYKLKKSNALMKALLRANLCRLLFILLISILLAGAEYLMVLTLKLMIDYFDEASKKDIKFEYLGIAYLCFEIISIFLTVHLQMKQNVFGTRAGFELSCFVFQKILNSSPSSEGQRATQGELVNFIQVDSQKLSWMIEITPSLVVSPIMIAAYIYLLFDFFGLSFFAGILMMAICLAINYKIFHAYIYIQEDMMKKKDTRMKYTTEAFDNIKTLKLYNWENEFKRKILESREAEINTGWRGLKYTTANISIFWFCPVIVAIATIGAYQYLNGKFNIGTMLIGLAIFAKLQDPVRDLPIAINSIVETYIAMKRIEKFIRQPDRKEDNVHRGPYDPNGEFAIKIENGNFSWGEKQQREEDKKESDKKDKEKKEKKKIEDKIEENIKKEVNEPIVIDTSETETLKNNNNDNITNQTKETDEPLIAPENEDIKEEIPKESVENKKTFDIVLEDISLLIKPGEVVGIIGEVGSGKSSLFEAILNSLIILNPDKCDGIHINGSIGYVSQIPWIQNSTIKDNILYFKEFDEEKYKKILEVSQLQYDLKTLEGGDKTEIGEKGINLSGGQKTRVSLARVLYSDPDIYLFDDPISALDANIGKKIMKDCIINFLKGKTRLIATHAVHFLKYMDRIIYLNKGKIEWSGNYQELLSQPFFDTLKKMPKLSNRKKSEELIDDDDEDLIDTEEKVEDIKESKEGIARITRDEDQEIGVVKLSVYKAYAKFMGGTCFLVMIMIIMLLWQVNKGGSDLWLAYWSQPENQKKSDKWVFFGIYSALGVASAIFIFFRIFLLGKGTIRLCRLLHEEMISVLIKAPINLFHETVPRGQIFNRLSNDLETVQWAMFSVGSLLVGLFTVLGALVICSVYDAFSLIFLPFICIIGYFLTVFYLIGSRQLSRLELISRSPLLNTINETIPGTVSIYASNTGHCYLNKFFDQVNKRFVIKIFLQGVQNWFSLQFSYISFFYMVYLVIIAILKQDTMTSQSVGIMFTYSAIMQRSMGALFLYCSEIEITMVSMERCLKYLEIISEKPAQLESDKELVSQKWPKRGEIRFENYSVKYRPNTEIVLKNLSFIINGMEKVGIVGRTGSGKSTICLCLFRILEPLTGTIYIDDQDICNIGLDLLRKSITIIPQDPCLMAGTLKYNIDPFNKTENKEILQVLNKIGFEGNNLKEGENLLDKEIEQNGKNLSVGEKQLVCIARAILRKTRIIVMDEATANIDVKTEGKIQNALEHVLKDSTIITIAHRIRTIINYDKILVLDNGKVAEYDTPSNLLNDHSSLFYELYSKSEV